MHGVSHWLGLDTHDPAPYRDSGGDFVRLEPGMVFTVEPGVDIPKDEDVAPEFRGIGIRIEDTVAVNRGRVTVLTEGVPKTPDDLESALRNPDFPAFP